MESKFKIGILLAIFFSLFITYNLIIRNQVSYATSRYGSSGSEVRTIQTKLKNWGYYSGSVDGVYGSKTLAAVKKFQRKNGLTADGIAGTATLHALGIYSSSSSSSSKSSVSNSNLNLISRFVYAESRGEPYTGQVAVASVILAQDAINGWDPSYGAVYYFNPATATSKWIWSRQVTVTIGHHRFCK